MKDEKQTRAEYRRIKKETTAKLRHYKDCEFLVRYKLGESFTQLRKSLKISHEYGIKLLELNGLPLPSRKKSAMKRKLKKSDICSRIMDDSVYLRSYDIDSATVYVFWCPVHKKEYEKKGNKISKPIRSPYGKSGYVLSEEEFQENINNRAKIKYKIVKGTFKNTKLPVTIECPKGHVREVSKGYLAYTKGCPECNRGGCISQAEIDLRQKIEELGLKTDRYLFDRPDGVTGQKKEIDIYLPDHKIGIEYNGAYWHADRQDDYKKYEMAKDFGIKLFTVYDYQLKKTAQPLLSLIRSNCDLNENRIFARKCTIKELSPPQATKFLEENHLQGPAGSFLRLGIIHNDEIVGIMTFSKHNLSKKTNPAVLNRMAFKYNTTVIGGASKLLKHSIPLLKNMGYDRVITWSDNSYSDGSVYGKIGFTYDVDLRPDYKYFKNGKITNKRHLRLTLDEKLSGKTERQLRKEQGYIRIYDCGKKRWILNF